MTFGEKVRRDRRRLGWTQKALADALGVSVRTVVSYENGTSYPKQREMYARMAELFGTTQNDLLAETSTDEEAPVVGALRGKNEQKTMSPAEGRAAANQLVTEMRAMFSGGALTEEDRDAVMRALQEAYWDARRREYAR